MNLNIEHIIGKIKEIRSFGRGMRRNPSFAWNVLLGVFVLFLFLVSAVGYLTYYRVGHQELINQGGSQPVRGILNPGEITKVMGVYQKKKADLSILIASEPTYPFPMRGGNEGKGTLPVNGNVIDP